MSRNFTPDDLFKKQLSGMPFEPSEAGWQKIETALKADQQHKKDKRRWIVILLLVLATGGAAYIALQKDTANRKPKTTIAGQTEKQSSNHTITEQPVTTSTQKQQPSPAESEINPATSNAQIPAETETVTPSADKVSKTTITTVSPPRKTSGAKAVYQTKQAGIEKASRAKKERNSDTPEQPFFADAPMPVIVKDNEPAGIAMKTADSKEPELTIDVAASAPKEAIPGTQPEPAVPVTTATTQKPAARPVSSKLYVNGGAAIAPPFNKTGYYGGLMLIKTTRDKKHFYTGLSLVNHKLEHEYISASKLNGPSLPVTNDAVVDRMTTLRLSAGYLFPLNGKKEQPNSFIMAGFEPGYAIGLRTLYYETPGQPAIINSPVMSKAVNRFSLFFTAGWLKEFRPGIGLSLKAGYGLIPITNREFYNRTLKNNNIKSLEVGLQYRISKK